MKLNQWRIDRVNILKLKERLNLVGSFFRAKSMISYQTCDRSRIFQSYILSCMRYISSL